MTRFGQALNVLGKAGVEFILIGGVAANVHGAVRATDDLDNLDRLVAALAPFQPYLRGAPAGLPFRFDRETLSVGLNFTLTTSLGSIDLLGEVTGGGNYAALVSHSEAVEMFGIRCLVLDLDTLIATKKAAARLKDLDAVAELNTIRERRRR